MELNFLILLVLFAISAFFLQISVYQTKHTKLFFLFIAILIPTILATFRNNGTDTSVYLSLFNQHKGQNLLQIIYEKGFTEIGDSIFVYIGNIFSSFRLYLFLYSFSNIVVIVLAIRKLVEKNLVGISLFLYYCMYYPISLNTMRQSLAIAIVLFSYYYLLSKNFNKFLLLIIIASQFHVSSLAILPLYYVTNRKKEIHWQSLLLYLGVMLIFFLNFQNFLPIISEFLGNERYNHYSFYDGNINNNIFYLNTVILIFCYFIGNSLIKVNKYFKFYFYLFLIGVIVGMSGFASPYLKRIAEYYNIIQIILIPQIFVLATVKQERYLVRWVLYLFGIIYFILLYVILKFSGIIPFYIFFNNI